MKTEKELKTLKGLQTEAEMVDYFEDIKEFDVKRITRVVKGGIKKGAIKRLKMLNDIFLKGTDFDISPAKTQREAYFHQLGKFEELKRFCDVTGKDLK